MISDSICRAINDSTHIFFQSVPGATVDKIRQYVDMQMVEVRHHQVIIIHVGTNNIERSPEGEVCQQFVKLLQAIRRQNATALLAVSSILPRPKDWNAYGEKVQRLNKLLEKMQAQHHFTFLKTYRAHWDQMKKMPRRDHFARDGLHLSARGVAALKSSLEGAVKRLSGNRRRC